MPFTSPLALLGLLFIPAVLAMYMLKLRRDRAVVPSTLLWSRLLTDVEANAPWQKLRRSLLLLLQLLLVVIIALLAARPFLERPAGLAGDIVLIVDTSASMAATDVAPTRLDAAKAAAIEALRDLPTGGTVSVIAADRTARIVVNESKDLGRVRQAIGDLQPSTMAGDLGDALELASKLAARSGQAQVLVATDAAIATVPDVDVDAPDHRPARRPRPQEPGDRGPGRPDGLVGRHAVRLRRRREPGPRRRRSDGSRSGATASCSRRATCMLDAQARSDVVIDDVPDDVRSLEVRLVAPGATAVAAPDQLAIDDRAWAVIPPDRKRLILVVGKGDPYLETALSYLPNVELFGVTPEEYGPATARKDGRPWDLVIFEAALPATLPDSPILAIAPPRTSPLGEVEGTLKNPGIGSLKPDEPILRYVDLTTTHIAQAAKLVLPGLGADRHPRAEGRSPPVRRHPRRAADGGPRLRAAPVRPAAPGRLPDPARQPDRRAARRIRGPDRGHRARDAGHADDPERRGRADRDPPGRVHDRARRAGDRRRDADLRPDRAPRHLHRHARPRPERLARAERVGGSRPAAASASPPPAVDPYAPTRFAVDLFDVGESTIAPGSAVADRGPRDGARRVTRRPGHRGSRQPPATTRDELWVPILLIVLLALCVEWAVYHRDAVIRLRRSLAARFGRTPADGST